MKILFIVMGLSALASCSNLASTDLSKGFSFPNEPEADEVVVYIASRTGYVSNWEYFSLELNGEYKILNFGDCVYFSFKKNKFLLRSKRNVNRYPITELERTDLRLGHAYYYIREGTGKSRHSPFIESAPEELKPICSKHGFGRVSSAPPNARWGLNDLEVIDSVK